MKQVPYHDNPGNACALACYTMAAQYLLPNENISFENLGKLSKWEPGYAVWGFGAWKFIMDHNVEIIDYDSIDYSLWVKDGFDAIEKTLPPKEFEFIKKVTFKPDELKKLIEECLIDNNFTYIQRKPTWDDVLSEYSKPGICNVTLNSDMLNGRDGFTGHQVVIIEINDDEVICHDPNFKGTGAYRKVSLELFKKSFEDNPELTKYSLKN